MIKKTAMLCALFFFNVFGYGLCHCQVSAANMMVVEKGPQAFTAIPCIEIETRASISLEKVTKGYWVASDAPTIGFASFNAPASSDTSDSEPSSLTASAYDSLDRLMANNAYYAPPSMPSIIQLLLDGKPYQPPDAVVVGGPAAVDESGGAQYTATAHFSDGRTEDVTARAAWSEDAAAASISSDGYLTTGAVDADAPVGVTAVFGGQTDTLAVTIKDVPTPVNWIDDSLEFRFAVQENGGAFLHAPAMYFSASSDKEECSYRPGQSQFDSYSCVANGNLTAFISPPGEIQLKAMAKGPENGVGPSDGLKVQGYLETLPTDLTIDHAIETEQTVISWVSRGFGVDQASTFTIAGILDGVVQFAPYNNGSRDRAIYGIEGKVMLEEVIDTTLFVPMPGFPLIVDETNPAAEMAVALRTQTPDGEAVKYRLRILLKLEGEIVNYNQQPYTINRAVNGTFRLGTASAPFTLEAKIYATGAANP